MTIKFTGEVHEFSFDTPYFIVTPQDFFYISETEQEILYWIDTLSQKIKNELMKMGGGIIWWHVKPQWTHAKIGWPQEKDPETLTDEQRALAEQFYCWKGHASVATSPALPEDIYTRLTPSFDEFKKTSKKIRESAIMSVVKGAV